MSVTAPLPGIPPVSVGLDLETQSVDALLAAHHTLIARIKLGFGLDRASFERDVLPLIRTYAEFVHWLPATASDFFARPGGLFHLGLETAFYALQGTDAHIFSGRLTISARRHLEPRWRQATFIAGLCSELHRAIGPIHVIDDEGEAWPAFLQPLSSWMQSRPARRFQLQWLPQVSETRSLGLLALPHVVPSPTLQFLATENEVVVPHLLACIGGLPFYRGRNVLDELVRRALALVVERDLCNSNSAGESSRRPTHQARYLIEGIQRLTANEPSWLPNSDKSRLWYATDGLFLVWPGAAHDLHRLLEGEQLVGMPKAPDAMLAQLLTAEVIEPTTEGEPLWRIRPRTEDTPLTAVKLASPDVILRALESAPQPLQAALSSDATPPSRSKPPESQTGRPPPIDKDDVSTPSLLPPARPDDATAPATGWQLKAPLRLNTTVRQALAAILAEMSGRSGAPGDTTKGLFVPLEQFEAHHLTPAIAVRALAEAGMLALGGAPPHPTIHRRRIAGSETTGIVLQPRFIAPADTA